jgi:hypothetical protein
MNRLGSSGPEINATTTADLDSTQRRTWPRPGAGTDSVRVLYPFNTGC